MTEETAEYIQPERYVILSNEPVETAEVEQIPASEEAAAVESESEVESDIDETTEEKKRGYSKRVQELANKARAAEERAQAAEAALAARTNPPPDKPNPDDFVGGRYNDNYQDALDAWRDAQTERRISQALVQAERDKAISSRKSVIAEREAEFKAVTPDYDEMVVHALPLFDDPLTNTAITEIENITEIAYTIGKDPELLAQFERMTPSQRLVKMGMMAAQGSTAPSQKPVRISQAAKPITPVSGGSAVLTSNAAMEAALKAGDFEAYKAAKKAAK